LSFFPAIENVHPRDFDRKLETSKHFLLSQIFDQTSRAVVVVVVDVVVVVVVAEISIFRQESF
jgi:hypothetical protein